MQFYQMYKPNKLYNWGSTQELAQVLSKDLTLRATLTSKYQSNFGAIQIAVSRNLHSLNISFELVHNDFLKFRFDIRAASDCLSIKKMRSFMVKSTRLGNVTGIIRDNLIDTSDLTWIQL